ncbi:hypothetical protein [Paludibaculum fermentans]|uniref:hypothetical protein n=1 Tax=Paludibaculum fermentans TaxID=1473598 RepID=UPI003EC0344D
MKFPRLRMSAAACLACLALAVAGPARANDAGWPRIVHDGSTEIIVYQPQPDSLDGVTLQSRVAVSIKRPQDQQPVFGALWVAATLSTDRDRDIAEVRSVQVLRTRFTGIPDGDLQGIVSFLEKAVPRWDLSLSLSRLRATLQPVDSGGDPGYRNDPPRIVIENRPALLLLLDGPPRFQETGKKDLQVVANTALPVIFDTKHKEYWLSGSSVWFTTRDLLQGEWKAVDSAPSSIQDLVKESNPQASPGVEGQNTASAGQLRLARIVVATEPTELVVVQGAPNYAPLAGGDILYVSNSESDIFLEVATQRHFLLISGRWYAAPSLQGPWAFITPDTLPKGFALIPENSPKANVLAFIPGTDRAKDALMDNVIPQTAEVSRSNVKIDVAYDGEPRFSPIQGTTMSYAVNTPSQVIQADGRYFACEGGVWYSAPTPSGPWQVSDVRPTAIDRIPPSSPVYNTRYVYIYDSTPDVVYVGYLPGYRWSLPYRGVIVYGTGWHYPGWYGTVYYPRPATWGFAVRYNPWAGWSFGMSWNSGWLGLSARWGSGWGGWGPAYPGPYRHYNGGWFGPGGYRPPRPPDWRPPYRPIGPQPYPGPRPWAGPGGNIYNRPGQPGIRPQPYLPARPPAGEDPLRPVPMRPDPGRPNNVYVDHNGDLHRNTGGGWQRRDGGNWSPERPSPTPRAVQPERPRQFPGPRVEPRGSGSEDERRSRERGAGMAGPGFPRGGGRRGSR